MRSVARDTSYGDVFRVPPITCSSLTTALQARIIIFFAPAARSRHAETNTQHIAPLRSNYRRSAFITTNSQHCDGVVTRRCFQKTWFGRRRTRQWRWNASVARTPSSAVSETSSYDYVLWFLAGIRAACIPYLLTYLIVDQSLCDGWKKCDSRPVSKLKTNAVRWKYRSLLLEFAISFDSYMCRQLNTFWYSNALCRLISFASLF